MLLDLPVHKSHFCRGRSIFECTNYGSVATPSENSEEHDNRYHQQPAKLQHSAEVIFSKYRYIIQQIISYLPPICLPPVQKLLA